MTEHVDPFMPKAPRKEEPGRLLTCSALEPGWPCRWCGTLLSATPAGGVLCLNCDPMEPAADV